MLFQAGAPSPFGVSADGQRILMNEAAPTERSEIPELTVVVNWLARAGRR
jgi:hypothetical protein